MYLPVTLSWESLSKICFTLKEEKWEFDKKNVEKKHFGTSRHFIRRCAFAENKIIFCKRSPIPGTNYSPGQRFGSFFAI